MVLFNFLGTEFRLNPWPIGGAVQINELSSPALGGESRELILKKIAVLLAGPGINFASALGLGLLVSAKAGNIDIRRCLALCANQLAEIVKALVALFLFRNQRESNAEFNYYTFLEIPFRAAESRAALICILFSTALSEAIFNLLPIPFLDGGKFVFELCSLSGQDLDSQVRSLVTVMTGLLLCLMFFAAIYRGLRWPIPKSGS